MNRFLILPSFARYGKSVNGCVNAIFVDTCRVVVQPFLVFGGKMREMCYFYKGNPDGHVVSYDNRKYVDNGGDKLDLMNRFLILPSFAWYVLYKEVEHVFAYGIRLHHTVDVFHRLMQFSLFSRVDVFAGLIIHW
ncbi:hypothetical protein HanIR_Chr13g0657351 [Helianthus annuus]|nr:hypothetical protein HanIR_Chr13g0657351 [Helianthus annuus]